MRVQGPVFIPGLHQDLVGVQTEKQHSKRDPHTPYDRPGLVPRTKV